MGESSCVGPETSNGGREVNLVSALRESVSFGRFMSESLDWGKWSSFHHNRHLEEVKKYSTPGSVAQKKALFEAHYKRIAAQKSAALQEEGSSSANNAPERESSDRVFDNGNSISRAESEELSGEVAADEAEQVETPAIATALLPSANESNLDGDNYGSEREEVEKAGPVMEGQILVEPSLRNESIGIVEDVENQSKDTDGELRRTSPLEKQPLKESCVTNQEFKDSAEKKPRIPIVKSSVRRSSRIPPSPASKPPLSPAKPVSSMHFIKEIKSTPGSKKYGMGSNDKHKSARKSLHMSINLTQYQGGNTPLPTRMSPVVEKVGDTKVASNSLKASQRRLHPLQTPPKASSNGVPKLDSVTPQSEKRRTKTTPQQTISGRRKADEQLHTESADCSKCSSTRGIRARTQIVSSSLSFRTDERAQKRKEFFLNLEDKVDAKEAKKSQPQGTAKIPLTRPRSPKLGRANNFQVISGPKSLPPVRTSFKSDKSTHLTEKSNRMPTRSVTSLPKRRI